MLAKVGNLLVDEKQVKKFKKISMITFIIGIVLFITLPLLTERIYILEKQLKGSEHFANQISSEFVLTSVKEYFNLAKDYKFDKQQNIVDYMKYVFNKEKFKNTFSREILSKNSLKVDFEEEVFTVPIISQRGDRTKYIMINIIYDSSQPLLLQKNLFSIYSFIKHFQDRNSYHWLAKDIHFNFISKELFYRNPQIFLENLIECSGEYNNQFLESVVNLDLMNTRFDSWKYLLLKIHGANSENVDMDFYKTFFDNFQFYLKNEGIIKTHYPVFSDSTKFYLKNILNNINSLIGQFFPKSNKNKIHYPNDFVYFVENIIDNFLLANGKIDGNNLTISKGIYSILIKPVEEARTDSRIEKHQEEIISFSNKNIKECINFLQAMERIVKNLSKVEIDSFRGEHNYILTSSHSFSGAGFFLFIPVLCVVRVFYEILQKIYLFNDDSNANKIHKKTSLSPQTRIEEKRFSGAKICFYLMIIFLLHFLTFVNIDWLEYFLHKNALSTFYHILIFNFILTFAFFKKLDLSKAEEANLSNILRFLIAVNCFNFFFVNYGFGLLMTVWMLPLELLLVILNDKYKKTFMQVFLICFVGYCNLMEASFIENIINNFIEHTNHIYILLTFIMMFLNLRLNLVIRRYFSRKDRINQKIAQNNN
jgi:hypothetical protein